MPPFLLCILHSALALPRLRTIERSGFAALDGEPRLMLKLIESHAEPWAQTGWLLLLLSGSAGPAVSVLPLSGPVVAVLQCVETSAALFFLIPPLVLKGAKACVFPRTTTIGWVPLLMMERMEVFWQIPLYNK